MNAVARNCRISLWILMALLSGVSAFSVACALATFESGTNNKVGDSEAPVWHSPYDLAFSPDGSLIATSDRSAKCLWLIDTAKRQTRRAVPLRGDATGVTWAADGSRVYVSEFGASTVAAVDPTTGQVVKRFAVDRHPEGLAIAGQRNLLLVANATTHKVSLIDLITGKERASISVPREPHHIAVTPDERLAVVGNLLPAGRGTDLDAASVISLIDLETDTHAGDLRLPPGSTTVRDIVINSDGRRAYVAHVLGRNSVPSTQLERGWVNTNALTILDLDKRTRYATVLLDNPVRGAADPWGLALSPDNSTLWITLSGVHEVARIDLRRLESYLAGGPPDTHRLARVDKEYPSSESIWLRIKRDGSKRAALANDLAALSSADLIERLPLPGQGPRAIAMSPDGKQLAAAVFFSGTVLVIDAKTFGGKLAHGTQGAAAGGAVQVVQLGKTNEPDLARLGEMMFHDATKCFQHWLSCATCHPNNGRVDGLNWDQTQDGIGNPKNNKSLLQAQHTAPMDWRAIRVDMELGVLTSFQFLMRQPEAKEEAAVQAYIRSLTPLPSPHLNADLELTAAAKRGRDIFESRKARCSHCHAGEYYTDTNQHNVGTRAKLDRSDKFDTPSLVEIYHTGPYLHDGSAGTIREVLVERNQGNRHGRVAHLTPTQLDDLIAYLESL